MKNKLISVIVICQNNEDSLINTLGTVLKQTYQNIELFIIKDIEVTTFNKTKVSDYIRDNKRDNINNVIIEDNQNKKFISTFIESFRNQSQGGYQIILTDNDIVLQDSAFEIMINELNENENCQMIVSQVSIYDNSFKNKIDDYINPGDIQSISSNNYDWLKNEIIVREVLPMTGLIYTREAIDQIRTDAYEMIYRYPMEIRFFRNEYPYLFINKNLFGSRRKKPYCEPKNFIKQQNEIYKLYENEVGPYAHLYTSTGFERSTKRFYQKRASTKRYIQQVELMKTPKERVIFGSSILKMKEELYQKFHMDVTIETIIEELFVVLVFGLGVYLCNYYEVNQSLLIVACLGLLVASCSVLFKLAIKSLKLAIDVLKKAKDWM